MAPERSHKTMAESELKTASAVKLSPFVHFAEPTDDTVNDTAGSKEPQRKWADFATMQQWFDRHAAGCLGNYNDVLHDTGRVEVGTLKGTKREVFAEFVYRGLFFVDVEDIKKNSGGAFVVRLVAGPIFHPGGFWSIGHVPEADLSDQHGLKGFHPCAVVEDWSIVDYNMDFAAANLEAVYGKVVAALLDIIE